MELLWDALSSFWSPGLPSHPFGPSPTTPLRSLDHHHTGKKKKKNKNKWKMKGIQIVQFENMSKLEGHAPTLLPKCFCSGRTKQEGRKGPEERGTKGQRGQWTQGPKDQKYREKNRNSVPKWQPCAGFDMTFASHHIGSYQEA